MREKIIVLRESASQAVNTTVSEPNYIGASEHFAAVVEIEYVSGSGTLDVWLQTQLPSGAWEDLARITQLGSAGKQILRWVFAGEESYLSTDASLAAGQIRNGPTGDIWRLKSTVGTSAVVWKATAGLYS